MRRVSARICSDCLPAYSLRAPRTQKSIASRTFSSRSPLSAGQYAAPKDEDEDDKQDRGQEEGAMSRRLSVMAEETMDTGSKSDRKLMKDAGFSEELKRKLEERISQTAFQAKHQQPFSEVNMPSSAGQGTRDQAAAQSWTGNESLHDAALRMLDDSYKRIKAPPTQGSPRNVNLKPLPKKKTSTGQRLANARDKTSIYALAQQVDMTEEDREKLRKEMKERFLPAARPMPTTLQGLTSLANERIEDAIARGQFRNIPRGKGMNVERDYNASSPFLDTTEYFMNKIIQKQEIVPPWIEKQQELIKLVSNFRSRLRNDWKRHAARSISSKGGSLEEQVRQAQAFALAEQRQNPKEMRVERLSEINSDGILSTVTVMETSEPSVVNDESPSITILEISPEDAPLDENAKMTAPEEISASESQTETPLNKSPAILPMAYPFRDPQWEKTENAYHTLAVNELNSITRSYNLMAPKIAQKPYHTLRRELNRCFADVAPVIPDEIVQRARAPKVKLEIIGHREGGIMEKFGNGHIAKVRDEDVKKGYGFKELWRDLFRREEASET